MKPFHMLHSLGSIPSTLEHNLQESLQVQLDLTRKGEEEYLLQVVVFLSTLYSALDVKK